MLTRLRSANCAGIRTVICTFLMINVNIYEASSQNVTYSEVNIRASGTQLKLDLDHNRVELEYSLMYELHIV